MFRKVCVFDVSRAVGIARFESVSESQPALARYNATKTGKKTGLIGAFPEPIGASMEPMGTHFLRKSQPRGKSRSCAERGLLPPDWRLLGQATAC